MKVIACHSPHARCGIAEYGRQLDGALIAAGVDVQPLTFAELAAAPQRIAVSGAVVLVHFEPALIPPGLLGMLQAARSAGARVVVCCHWYEQSAFSPMALRIIDRFVLHRRYPGVAHPKFVEIPLGCPVYEPPTEPQAALRARLGLPLDKIIVTTVGFLTRWKRMPELLDALLGEQLSDGDEIVIQALMPPAFNDLDGTEERQARAALSRHSVERQRQVILSTEFRPAGELLDRISASDVGFLFHGQDTGSVSAATKQFVSTRRGLIATGSTHASDLRQGVHRVRSFEPREFAREMVRVARGAAARADLSAGMELEYERINMNVVARQYLDLFGSLQ